MTARPVTTTGYDTFGDTAETQDPDGNVTTYGYDADGRQVSETLPPYTPPGGSSAITAVDTTAYDGDGNVTSATDGLDNTTTYGYDQQGNQVTVTDPDHSVTTTAYDTDGEPLSVTDPTGAVTDVHLRLPGPAGDLDADRAVLRRPGPRPTPPATPTTTRAGGGWLSQETTPDGVDHPVLLQPGRGEDRRHQRRREHHLVLLQLARRADQGHLPRRHRDRDRVRRGRQRHLDQRAWTPPGDTLATTSAAFDGEGDQLSSTDADGNSTTFTYDPTGMVTQEVQPVSATSGITTSFGYDAAGNQTLYTDGNGSQWWDTYNSWGLQQSRVEPPTAAYTTAANSTFTLAYDADQNPVTETEPGGVTVSEHLQQRRRADRPVRNRRGRGHRRPGRSGTTRPAT